MKKATSKLLSLILGAALAVTSLVGIAACGETGNTGDTGDPNIRLVYDMYVENCAAKGEEALTYEDWLASIKGEDGEDGKDGVTPHIGANGNWYIGEEDTHIPATGAKGDDGDNGVTPHIGANGNWYIGEEDTHIPATGAKGDDGDDGTNGTSFLHGKGKPDAALGSEGDLYLDLETYDLYEKTAEGWSTDPVGNIKGAKGDKGDSATGGETEPAETVIKEYKGVTINSKGQYTLDVSGVNDGCYWLIADTSTTAEANVLTVNCYGKTNSNDQVSVFDMYSSATSTFKGLVMVGCAGHEVTVNNISNDNITVDLKLVEYKTITLTLGQTFEIPCIGSSFSINDYARVPVSFDDALSGKSVKVTFTYWTGTRAPDVRSYDGNTLSELGTWLDTADKQEDLWSKTLVFPQSSNQLLFFRGSERSNIAGFNAVVKIEEVS